MGESERYKTAVRSTGFVCKFYECIKTSAGEGAVERILMPVAPRIWPLTFTANPVRKLTVTGSSIDRNFTS